MFDSNSTNPVTRSRYRYSFTHLKTAKIRRCYYLWTRWHYSDVLQK